MSEQPCAGHGIPNLRDYVLPSFAGMSIPYLTFTFASNHENINERRYVTQRLLPHLSNEMLIYPELVG